ncbi:hypothetical protein [Acinetobacter sp. ANC 4633]|nr:hypothetical protein [Acinetobacter sp. ANC 4633]
MADGAIGYHAKNFMIYEMVFYENTSLIMSFSIQLYKTGQESVFLTLM